MQPENTTPDKTNTATTQEPMPAEQAPVSDTNATQPQAPAKKPSTRASIAGGVFSVLAMLSGGIAYFITHSESRTHTEVTTAFGKVDSGPVAQIASNSIRGILSMPFIVVAIVFAIIALLFTGLRLRKIKLAGWIWSIIWIGLSIWAILLASSALNVIKFHPSN